MSLASWLLLILASILLNNGYERGIKGTPIMSTVMGSFEILKYFKVGMEITQDIGPWFQRITAGKGYHHLKVGQLSEPGNKVLWKEEFRVPGLLFWYARKDTRLGRKELGGATISAIACQDMWDDDTGGQATILEGGVRYDHVTIKFQSTALFRGFQFTVLVFGQ